MPADPAGAPVAEWWRREAIYQIYPWSFQDSNGDGIGDLPGLTSRLDYLNDGTPASLGVGAIWLSPVYPSPMKDFGYDVADYCDIDPRFGTLKDFGRLVDEAHRRGIRVLMDLVLNHTSDQHPWFIDARRSRSSPRRHWYYWADPAPGWRRRPPNNWQGVFGGPAWEWDSRTRQFYLHAFLKEQPDLNWHHPEVRRAMFDTVRFWLDRGVDGFRLDAINWIGKDVRWPDNPAAPGAQRWRLRSYLRQLHRYDRDQAETHRVLGELRRLMDGYPGAVLVGEASSDTPGGPASFYGNGSDELHLVFNFQLLKSAWGADRFRRIANAWDRAVPSGAWPTQVLSNHDQSRHITRYSRGVSEAQGDRRARLAALLLLTLRGTPFLYYGEELAMRDVRLRYRDLRDPYTKRYWPFFVGRDPARTPMQWNDGPHAGFSTVTPWLPVSKDYAWVNAARAMADPGSLFSLYRRLLHLRRVTPALLHGSYEDLAPDHPSCLVYRRRLPDPNADEWIVAANFSARPQPLAMPGVRAAAMVLSTDGARAGTRLDPPVLHPEEGLLLRRSARPSRAA